MENNQNDYNVSFFKPVTNRARKNRNMVLWLVVVWATAIFGFQILLRVIEKPTPEPAYNSFISVWDNVKTEDASNEELKTFANSVLTVLGKVYIKPEYKKALSNAFTWSVFQIAGDYEDILFENVLEFEKVKHESENIIEKEYVEKRDILEQQLAEILDVSKNDPRRLIAPFSVNSSKIEKFSSENKELTEIAMAMYLIHNQSVLTDTKFLGFPFHYFFTAVFLLVLFIVLCLIYCIQTDKIEKKEQNL